MKTGLNDIKIKKTENCITGKYKFFYTFPESLRGFYYLLSRYGL